MGKDEHSLIEDIEDSVEQLDIQKSLAKHNNTKAPVSNSSKTLRHQRNHSKQSLARPKNPRRSAAQLGKKRGNYAKPIDMARTIVAAVNKGNYLKYRGGPDSHDHNWNRKSVQTLANEILDSKNHSVL